MRDYQRRKHTKYKLPRAVYNQTLWRIRDYYRMKEIAESMIESKSETGGSSHTISDKVGNTAAKRERFLAYISEIDYALNQIPEEYRAGVWNNIQKYTPYPRDAARATYGRYKSQFIYIVADRFGLI